MSPLNLADKFEVLEQDLLERAGNDPQFLSMLVSENKSTMARRAEREAEARAAAERLAALERAQG